MHQPVTFEILSIGYTIVDHGSNPSDSEKTRPTAAQTARRIALSTLAAIVVIVVGCFAVTGIDRFTQRQQWKANITTNMASTVAAIDTLDLQNHGNIGFKDKDISCTDTRACFLNADAGIVTTGPARLRTENPAGRRRFHYPPAFHQRRACHEQLCRHRRKRPFPRFMHLLVANRRDQLQSAEVTL